MDILPCLSNSVIWFLFFSFDIHHHPSLSRVLLVWDFILNFLLLKIKERNQKITAFLQFLQRACSPVMIGHLEFQSSYYVLCNTPQKSQDPPQIPSNSNILSGSSSRTRDQQSQKKMENVAKAGSTLALFLKSPRLKNQCHKIRRQFSRDRVGDLALLGLTAQ